MSKPSKDVGVSLDPVVRTGEGLRDALFDEIDGLRNGTRNPQHSIAVAKLSCQIINTVRIEVEYQRHLQANRTEGAPETPQTVRLGKAA